ncbi:MAG: Fic family protein [Chloroflexi bacterium]|nr:Fic family protein [Chloroflexota bacterium]
MTKFLTVDQVKYLNARQIDLFGGNHGEVHADRIEEALAAARRCTTLHEIAAAYLFHLVYQRPFNDGHRRTAAVAARMFLSENGYDLRLDAITVYEMADGLDKGRITLEQAASILRRNIKPRRDFTRR